MKSLLFLFFVFFFGKISSFGLDWPTYGGPQNNHTSQEKTLQLDWGDEEPDILWKHEVGLGYSSVIEVDGLAYTQGYKNKKNTLFCVDAKSGDIKWTHSYDSALGDKYFQGGSRSTPTIAKGKVYLQGHEGPLFCLNARTGKLVWKTHLVKDLDGR